MERIIRIAANELGVKEHPGPEHNPRIIEYAHEAGMEWVNDDETPWCSIFMNWVAAKAKVQKSGKANARSWLDVGAKVEQPEPGDIVVYWRKKKSGPLGHVGVFFGFSQDKTRIYTLGGNQMNAVSVSAYSINRLLEFRRLSRVLALRLSTKVLTKDDRGPEVVKLQDALKMAGFDCGTSDGHFGPKTEGAVKELQESSNGELGVDGVFGKSTRLFLRDLVEDKG